MSITANSEKEFRQIDGVMDVLFSGAMETEKVKKEAQGSRLFNGMILIDRGGTVLYQNITSPSGMVLRGMSIGETPNSFYKDRTDITVSFVGLVTIEGEELEVQYRIPVRTKDGGCFVSIQKNK